MHRYLLHNGAVRGADEVFLSPGQVGLLNGWGVFSTLRIRDGVLFEWHRHWRRMQHDAALLRVPFPASSEETEQDLLRLVEANQAWNATMRVSVIRNRGGKWEGPAVQGEYDVVAFTDELNTWEGGVKLGVAPDARHAASEFAGVKYLSWADNLTRYERARIHGLDEVVLLNERGEVCECTSANIFAITGEHVWTPPLSAGCLPGVTRAVLLEELRAPGLRVAEKTLYLADLEEADEVFITSSTRAVLPVSSIEGLRIRQGGARHEKLQAAFSSYMDAYVARRRRPVPANR